MTTWKQPQAIKTYKTVALGDLPHGSLTLVETVRILRGQPKLTYKRTRKHPPVSFLSSDFQLCSQGLLYLHNFFGFSSRFKHFWHLNVMITEVRFIAIRIQAPLSLLPGGGRVLIARNSRIPKKCCAGE